MSRPIQQVLRDQAAMGHASSKTLIEAADHIDQLETALSQKQVEVTILIKNNEILQQKLKATN